MKIYLSDKLGKNFIFEYIPTFLYKMFLSEIYKYKDKIEQLLKEEKLTLKDFKEKLKTNFTIKKFGNYYIISIKQNDIERIMRIIDYGKIGFKGLNIFNKTFKYTTDNLTYLHNLWQKRIIL